jgi:hypothetical protein
MIRSFLKDLPYTLTQPMYREYEEKCRELERWHQHSRYQKAERYLREGEAIQFIFALGIYYRYVVAPLSSCANFFKRLESEFEAGLTVGGRRISPDFRYSLQFAVEHFHDLVRSFGLGPSFFAQTDVKRIVMTLIELEERRSNAQD